MTNLIKNILVPVQLNTDYISVLKQAAELARENNSIIHLLYIEPVVNHFLNPGLSRISATRNLYRRLKEKMALMSTWKRWLEHDYNIKVNCIVDWGNWKKRVINYASTSTADLIIIKYHPSSGHFFNLFVSPVEYVIKKSNCQVITILSEKDTLSNWVHIVIPITNYIPYLRILTIIRSAKVFNIKIHIIALAVNENAKREVAFHFLTETLKLLKPSGNIQVVCKYVNDFFNPINGYFKYANNIGADAIMTNNNKTDDQKSKAWKSAKFLFSRPILKRNISPLAT